MDDGIYLAANGMLLETKRQEIIAQNMAASSIPGYKKDFVVSGSFSDALNNAMGSNQAGNLKGTNGGQTHYDFTEGTKKKTDRRLDFAFDSYLRESDEKNVQGSQLFFQVKTPDGHTLLTRNGCFKLDTERNIVTTEGYTVLNEGGNAITLGADDDVNKLYVDRDGQVKVEDRNTSPSTIKTFGSIQLAMAQNPQALTRLTANYFEDTKGDAAVKPANIELFHMYNGYYEESNSSPIQEMNAMIQSVRDYEFQSKVVKSVQDLYKQELGKLSS